jgi:hypothetical protein
VLGARQFFLIAEWGSNGARKLHFHFPENSFKNSLLTSDTCFLQKIDQFKHRS